MTRDAATTGPVNLAEAITSYTGHGLAITPVRRNAKAGYLKGWSRPGHAATPADFRLDDNIRVLNGTAYKDGYFLHDIDIDANTDAARLIVERLLPRTGLALRTPD